MMFSAVFLYFFKGSAENKISSRKSTKLIQTFASKESVDHYRGQMRRSGPTIPRISSIAPERAGAAQRKDARERPSRQLLLALF
jgi:hypothetical protein